MSEIDHSGSVLATNRLLGRWLLVLLVFASLIGVGIAWWVQRPKPDDYFQTGLQAFSAKQADEVQFSAEALEVYPGYEAQSRLLHGMACMLREEYPSALNHFGEARLNSTTELEAYVLSGEVLYRLGQFADAIRVLQIAVNLSPDHVDAHRWLASAFYDIGAMDQALQHLETVSRLAPTDPRPHRLRGLIFRDFERYQAAIPEYREALRRMNDSASGFDVRFELAECLREQQDFAEALEALALCPDSADVLALRAECQYNLGNVEPASVLIDQALQGQPDHLLGLQLKATIAMAADDLELAVEVLQQAADSHPRDYVVRYKLVQVLRRLGRDDATAEQVAVMQELGELRKRFTELHKQAIEHVTDADLRFQIGQVAMQLGKPELAVGWFQAAISLDSSHTAARQALFEAQQTLVAPAETAPQQLP